MLLESFKHILQNECHFNEHSKGLVAVSGGIDSVVLLKLIVQISKNIEIAHCHFQLRDQEADLDHDFVKELAFKNEIQFHSKRFNTEEVAHEKGISIQMAARELRYDWFNQLKDKHNYTHLFVAHHLDDQLETVLINLGNSTGIKGIKGMDFQNGWINRPLLNFTKKDIEQFAKDKSILFREDQSNHDNKYTRNYLRNEVIPALKKSNPSFMNNFKNSLNNFNDDWAITEEFYTIFKEKNVEANDASIRVNKKALKENKNATSILNHILSGKGFSPKEYSKIIDCLSTSNKSFQSKSYKIEITKEHLLISKK